MLTHYSLVERSSGRIVVERIELAAGFWSRLRGLQFRAALPADHGLLLAPCKSIHTCFVRFPIDAAFLDATGRVAGVRHHIRPWRLVFAPRGTRAVLEMPAGTTVASVGERLALQCDQAAAAVPKALQFLGQTPG